MFGLDRETPASLKHKKRQMLDAQQLHGHRPPAVVYLSPDVSGFKSCAVIWSLQIFICLFVFTLISPIRLKLFNSLHLKAFQQSFYLKLFICLCILFPLFVSLCVLFVLFCSPFWVFMLRFSVLKFSYSSILFICVSYMGFHVVLCFLGSVLFVFLSRRTLPVFPLSPCTTCLL